MQILQPNWNKAGKITLRVKTKISERPTKETELLHFILKGLLKGRLQPETLFLFTQLLPDLRSVSSIFFIFCTASNCNYFDVHKLKINMCYILYRNNLILL